MAVIILLMFLESLFCFSWQNYEKSNERQKETDIF